MEVRVSRRCDGRPRPWNSNLTRVSPSSFKFSVNEAGISKAENTNSFDSDIRGDRGWPSWDIGSWTPSPPAFICARTHAVGGKMIDVRKGAGGGVQDRKNFRRRGRDTVG